MSIHRIAVVGAALLSASSIALGAPGGTPGKGPGHARMFGRGAPFAVSDLPQSALRRHLESLPSQTRGRALGWLHEFQFPGEDAHLLRLDKEGAVYYEDKILPSEDPDAAEAPSFEETSAAGAAVDDPFALHSRPAGALSTVYLDFTGHTLVGTAWNGSTGTASLQARPFDLDNSPSTFSAAERAAIAEIWHRVAEDYAAFDIDVTTEEPASFGPTVGRVLITAHTDANGRPMPSSTAGGVAYVNVWGSSRYASYYSPALVYFDNLSKGTTYIAEASAHEFGHNLGLSHDGNGSTAYYGGHGSDFTSWAPIMGNSYQRNVTEWSKGEYSGANNTQDDVAIIGSKLGFFDDDHGDTPATATPLLVSANGEILVSNPQNDAGNLYPENKGAIGQRGDKDVFRIAAGAGPLELSIDPAWDAFYRTSKRGANLDLRAVLTDSQGTRIAESNPASDTYAQLGATVAAGVYYLEVSAVGSANYSDYGSQGQYFVSGQVATSTAANRPPVAAFSHVCAGTACSFTDGSSDTDGSLVAWSWEFGDGGVSTARQPTHSYAAAGSYTVRLTVTDNAGAEATVTGGVTAAAPVNKAPTASFTASCFSRRCSFTDRSTDSDGSIQTWLWDFGDGTQSTLKSPTRTYAARGTYTVRLTVTDNGTPKLSATASRQLNVGSW
jgi:PKD repeat protein